MLVWDPSASPATCLWLGSGDDVRTCAFENELQKRCRAELSTYAANASPHLEHVRNFSSDLILSVANFTASVGSSKRTAVS